MAASEYAVALPRCVMSLIISAMLSPEKRKQNKVEYGLGQHLKEQFTVTHTSVICHC
jgi:hypothetical protein